MSIDFRSQSRVPTDTSSVVVAHTTSAPRTDTLQAWVDSMTAEVAVLDHRAVIVAVNAAWRQFAVNNHLPTIESLGANYLDICDVVTGHDRIDAQAVAQGIRGILRGDFHRYRRRYACHSATEQRWYLVKAWRIVSDHGTRIIVAHAK